MSELKNVSRICEFQLACEFVSLVRVNFRFRNNESFSYSSLDFFLDTETETFPLENLHLMK